MQRFRTIFGSIYRLYEHSGFSMAGAVAFGFVVSLFPFCIFLGALAGTFGGRELAQAAVDQLFLLLPAKVAQSLAPEVTAIMAERRFDLLTYSGGLALFFATSAIESMRSALNVAYRIRETRPYLAMLLLSMFFVLVTALSVLGLTWAVIVGPELAAKLGSNTLTKFLDSSFLAVGVRYLIATAIFGLQLLGVHLFLAAGTRRLADVWPGVLLSTAMMLIAISAYSRYLDFNDYTKFYAGLSQLMVTLIFFQVTAIIMILGAELNRGLIELRKQPAASET